MGLLPEFENDDVAFGEADGVGLVEDAEILVCPGVACVDGACEAEVVVAEWGWWSFRSQKRDTSALLRAGSLASEIASRKE